VQAKTKEDAGEKMTRHQKIQPRERREPLVCWIRMLAGPHVNDLKTQMWQAEAKERLAATRHRVHSLNGHTLLVVEWWDLVPVTLHQRPFLSFKSMRCAV
jgi:hypothetical protein